MTPPPLSESVARRLRRPLMEGLDDAPGPAPMARLQAWVDEAVAAGAAWAEVMSLATCGADCRPSVRAVVMRDVDGTGLVFETDHRSRKAAELTANPWASASFLWPELERQARCEGSVAAITGAPFSRDGPPLTSGDDGSSLCPGDRRREGQVPSPFEGQTDTATSAGLRERRAAMRRRASSASQ